MDRLESCYFCGTTNASLDEYPVVPDALNPAPDEQAAVTLCPDCREKLATVVKRIASAAEPPDEAAAPASGGAPGEPTVEPPEEPAEPEPARPGTDRSDDEAAAEPERGPESAAEAEEPPTTDATSSATPSPADEPDPDETEDDESEPRRPETLSPFQYNKVMRLLENREFPVAVAEFEAIATSAYELQPSDVEAVIEAAIDRGLIERGEDGETLHRRG